MNPDTETNEGQGLITAPVYLRPPLAPDPLHIKRGVRFFEGAPVAHSWLVHTSQRSLLNEVYGVFWDHGSGEPLAATAGIYPAGEEFILHAGAADVIFELSEDGEGVEIEEPFLYLPGYDLNTWVYIENVKFVLVPEDQMRTILSRFLSLELA